MTHNLTLAAQSGVLTYVLESGEQRTREGWFSLNKERTHVRFRRPGNRGIMVCCRIREIVKFEATSVATKTKRKQQPSRPKASQ